MNKMKMLLLGAAAACAVITTAYAAGMFPGLPTATLPIVGNECIPADTGLSGGRYPQTECISPTQLATFAGSPIGITDATTITFDASQANVFFTTLSGNRFLGTPTNPSDGQRITLFLNQDTTGGRTLGFVGIYKFPGGITPLWSTSSAGTASAINMISFTYRAFPTVGWFAESPIYQLKNP